MLPALFTSFAFAVSGQISFARAEPVLARNQQKMFIGSLRQRRPRAWPKKALQLWKTSRI